MRFIMFQSYPCGTGFLDDAPTPRPFHPGSIIFERGKRCGGMKGGSLREVSLPRFALRRDEAAAAISISPSLLDQWIALGLMPAGRKIRGVVLWDTAELFAAWCKARDSAGLPEEKNPFDGVTA